VIIAALNSYYQRLAEKEKMSPEGFREEKISYAIVISLQGEAVAVHDLRDRSGKKPQPKLLPVPIPPKRTAGIKACFLWDKTSYVLGVTKDKKERTVKEHRAFKDTMLEELNNTADSGLIALQKFLQSWSPEKFAQPPFDNNEEILDSNIIFKLDDDKHEYLHDRQAAKTLWLNQKKEVKSGVCMISGEVAPIARLHHSIKGVGGAQSSGASIVSFNQDSFTSFNKNQGDNSPVSKQIADQYVKALNYLLRKETKRKLAIGDATTVFWAIAEDKEADQAENFLSALLNPSSTDEQETGKLQKFFDIVGKGQPLKEFESDLDPNTEIFILGLSPNASRLSIRFWQTGTLEFFADKIAQHYRDLRLEPSPWRTPPSICKLVMETTPARKDKHDKYKHEAKDVLPHLAGEMMRAIISGRNYPYSLLTTIVMRMRTDGDISSLRVALVKAVITRKMRINNNEEEIPVSLDKNCDNQGYQLGRWFAELENAQRNALGKDIGATIKDQYYGSASANPAATFPTLIRKYHNHISKLDRDKTGLAVNIEKNIGEIVDKLSSEFPNTLTIEDQGRFAIGYYHQRSLRFTKKEDKK